MPLFKSTDASDIINYLKDGANEKLKSLLGSKPLEAFAVGSQGLFPYNWQSTINVTQFNKPTYDWISKNLKAGSSPVELDAVFTNLYIQAITNVSYSLSSADQAALNEVASNATEQSAAVQNTWLANMGDFPAGKIPINAIAGEIATSWADPPTTLQDIKNSINLNQLLNAMPAAGAPILPVFVNWLNAMSAGLALQNTVSLNTGYLNRAMAAAQTPTKSNGGVTLNDDSVQPSYPVTTPVANIQNSMKSGAPVVDMSMTVSHETEDEYSITLDSGVSFTTGFLFFTVSVDASANYFHSNIATSANETTVKMSYPGVNLVTFGPADFDMSGASKNWFWMVPINEAIANTDKDVSGYKFGTATNVDFSTAGPFGYTTGVAIASYPTITIVCKSADYQRIQSTFQQSVKTSVNFLGVGMHFGESTYKNHVEVDESNSTVTITLSPPPELVHGTVNGATGWILGVQTDYPGATG